MELQSDYSVGFKVEGVLHGISILLTQMAQARVKQPQQNPIL